MPQVLQSFTNTKDSLIFFFLAWICSSIYCFHISGHMALIVLSIFSTVLFTSILQSDWLDLSDLQSALVSVDSAGWKEIGNLEHLENGFVTSLQSKSLLLFLSVVSQPFAMSQKKTTTLKKESCELASAC